MNSCSFHHDMKKRYHAQTTDEQTGGNDRFALPLVSHLAVKGLSVIMPGVGVGVGGQRVLADTKFIVMAVRNHGRVSGPAEPALPA